VLPALLAVALVAASLLGAREPGKARAAPVQTPAPSLFRNIPQRGAVLGNPAAPVTLVEYADLQCPYCADWAVGALPVLVDEYVRSGKLRIVFRGMAFLGPESDTALRTAVAAGRQNRLWDVVHGVHPARAASIAGRSAAASSDCTSTSRRRPPVRPTWKAGVPDTRAARAAAAERWTSWLTRSS
jgi:hypothetical protein